MPSRKDPIQELAVPIGVLALLKLDEDGNWDKDIERKLISAWREDKQNIFLAWRTINHLIAKGNSEGADDLLTEVLLYNEQNEKMVNELLLPVISSYNQRGQLNQAKEVLGRIKPSFQNATYKKLRLENDRYSEIEEYGDFVPWQELLDIWWDKPSFLPPEKDSKPLTRFLAGRVEDIDEDIYFSVAICDQIHAGRPVAATMAITHDQFSEHTNELAPTSIYYEIGLYGEEETGFSYIFAPRPSGPIKHALEVLPPLNRFNRTF